MVDGAGIVIDLPRPTCDTRHMQAPHDFSEECSVIDALLSNLSDADFDRETAFKAWTIGDIVEHLHLFNIAADASLAGAKVFAAFCARILPDMAKGHRELQRAWFGETSTSETYRAWRDLYPDMAARFTTADPGISVKWFGPDMSAQSCIIARQMEHWAHAQAIYDVLGIGRNNGDRLKNVAHIGVTTHSWSFRVNGLEPPKPKLYVYLTTPSGAI